MKKQKRKGLIDRNKRATNVENNEQQMLGIKTKYMGIENKRLYKD